MNAKDTEIIRKEALQRQMELCNASVTVRYTQSTTMAPWQAFVKGLL
jgi:hypothetical protein